MTSAATRPDFSHAPEVVGIYEWLAANGVDEWLPEHPAITINQQTSTITYTAFVWTGPRGWDMDHTLGDRDGPLTERRTVPLVASLDGETALRIAHMRAEPTIVGYVDKSILVEVDGIEAAIGTVSVPVTLSAPASTAGPVVDVYLRVSAADPEVTVDQPTHDGCPADITLAAYVKTGDDRTHIGHLVCCAECRPTLPD